MTSVVPPIRVVIVDDDPLVRAGLKLILGGDHQITVVGEAGDGEEALLVVPRCRPHVVLMDIRMPVRDGLSAATVLLAAPQPPRIIVLTTFDTDDMVLRALRIGADGFLLKDTPPARLVEAVRTVAAGEPMLSPSVTATLIAAVSGRSGGSSGAAAERARGARAALRGLTEREHEVALAVGRGMTNAEIGASLYLSVPTVKAHIGRILTKLGADNRTQVAILVHDASLP